MALLMLRSSGFHGSPYAKELSIFDEGLLQNEEVEQVEKSFL